VLGGVKARAAYADRIARFDRDQAQQLRRSSVSVVLNVGEGSGLRAGRRRQTYDIALGEARETRANLEAAECAGYIASVDAGTRDHLDHTIATLVKLVC
jgi:four helix bundle protein